ncbi:sensor histidine kinase [Streptomyces albicerus]|uniref:sensor histidine kinase n=1 Tax=Streptomyces albicerus TaxID=2569859 RepID=UPI00298E9077|nr:HAMP domain-containing sensor histidine kinase [Streptomyces albicerus]
MRGLNLAVRGLYPAGSRTVALWLAATLATLGTVAALSAHTLGHHLAERTDQEIEKFRGITVSAAPGQPVLDEACLILVVDDTGRVTERYAGSPDLPPFPSLTAARLAALAAHGRTVAVGDMYRALVVRSPEAGADRKSTYVITARSMADAQRAVDRLLKIEAWASLPLLGAVAFGARRLGRRAEKERQASERRMREFLAAAGHELRNPLTAIAGYAELARAGPVPGQGSGPGHGSGPGKGSGPGHGSDSWEGRAESVQVAAVRDELLGRVATEVERMASLIDELMLLSRLDLGQPLQLLPVDLARLCRDAVTAARDCHPEHAVRLLVAPGEHTVTGDPLRLHQVIANLLANARVHTPVGTTTTLGLGTEDGYRVIEVTDDGPGVPPTLRPQIFERFVRGEEATAAGSGLGLSIVAAIAQAHGGTVTLEPSDRGAWFRVRLPAASPRAEVYPPSDF